MVSRPNEILSFAVALGQAVYDVEAEKNSARVLHYFDTDVVWRSLAVMGDRLAQGRLDKPAEMRDFLVGALWISGYGVRAHMLWPHIVELHGKVFNRRQAAEPGNIRESIKRLHGIESLNADLDAVMRSTSGGPPLRQAVIDRILPQLDYDKFIALEFLTNCGREQRAKKLGRVLDLNTHCGPPIEAILEDDMTWVFAEALDALRPPRTEDGGGSREGRPIDRRSVLDGAALVSLLRIAKEADRGTEIRFLSQTPAIASLLRSGLPVRASANSQATGIASAPDFAVAISALRRVSRESMYYSLRALLPCLSFDPVVRDNADDSDRKMLDELMSFRDELRDIADGWTDSREEASLTADAGALWRKLSEDIAGVGESFQRFCTIAFSANVWLGGKRVVVHRLAETIESWAGLEKLVESERVFFGETLKRQVGKSVADFELLTGDVYRIRSVDSATERFAGVFRNASAARMKSEFALMRWAMSFAEDLSEPEFDSRLASSLALLCENSTRGRLARDELRNHFRLGVRAQSLDAPEWAVSLCVAWGLGLADDLSPLFRRAPKLPDCPRTASLIDIARHGKKRRNLAEQIERLTPLLEEALKAVGKPGFRLAVLSSAFYCTWDHGKPRKSHPTREHLQVVLRAAALGEEVASELGGQRRRESEAAWAMTLMICGRDLPEHAEHAYQQLVSPVALRERSLVARHAVIWFEWLRRGAKKRRSILGSVAEWARDAIRELEPRSIEPEQGEDYQRDLLPILHELQH